MSVLYSLTNGTAIIRTNDGASIPSDTGNTDYQQYLAWVASGNTPDPAPARDNSAVIADSATSLKLQQATKLTAAGRTAEAFKILLQLNTGG